MGFFDDPELANSVEMLLGTFTRVLSRALEIGHLSEADSKEVERIKASSDGMGIAYQLTVTPKPPRMALVAFYVSADDKYKHVVSVNVLGKRDAE